MKSRKILKILSLILLGILLLFSIWYWQGMPYGYVPGHYDAEKKLYYSSIIGQTISTKRLYDGKYFRIAVRIPYYAEGIIDTTGRIIVPIKYDRNVVGNFITKTYHLTKNGKRGMASYDGKIIVPVKYDRVSYKKSSDNIVTFIARNDKEALFIDSDGNIMQKFPAEYHFKLSDKHLAVYKDSVMRDPVLFDYSGNKVIDGKYEFVKFTNDDIPFFIARKSWNEPYLIDKKTLKESKKDFIVNYTTFFSSDLIKASALYVDSIKESHLDWFSDSLVWNAKSFCFSKNLKYNTKFGLLSKEGEILYPFIYDQITSFPESNVILLKTNAPNSGVGLVDSTARRWIIPFNKNYANAKLYDNIPLIQVEKKNSYNHIYLDMSGTIILSDKINIIHIDDSEKNPHIVFRHKKKNYEMRYNNVNKKFYWFETNSYYPL